jgi:DNA modification methylase
VGVRGKEENNMAKIEITKTELVWPGKYGEDGTRKEVERVSLPFQVIETIKEARATREAAKKPKQKTLFDIWEAKEGDTFEEGWKNKLIWGDNLLIMGSLLEKFAGKIDLIYIDPPFATGADFTFNTQIGESELELKKEQSLIEEKAYRDTWGRGLESYLQMIYERLIIMREMLTENGSIYIHLGWNISSYILTLMNEVFGEDCLQNIIIYNFGKFRHSKERWKRDFDVIFFYSKNPSAWTFNHDDVLDDYQEKTEIRFDKVDEEGMRYKIVKGRRVYYQGGVTPSSVWRLSNLQINAVEYLAFPTQKTEELLTKIIKASSNIGDLVADLFCGSGTTLAVAEKLGRRWIGCDLSRWAIHVSRKRLLEIENSKPFEVLNLGKYERKYWQGVTFGDKKKSDQQLAIYQYLAFILKLYGAEPISGMQHLHGKNGKAVVHVGAVDAPVTIDEINACLDECVAIQQKELHVLGWEWEMGLYDLMTDAAKGRGVKLVLLNIPREVMEQQAVDKGDIRFFELAYLEVDIKQEKGRKIVVSLKDFVIPNTELIPEETRSKIKKWPDYIDYWAVDWDFQNDTFMNGWVTYRTRKDRTLSLKSDVHTYEKPGKYMVMIKVVDIFGNDTSQAFEIEVK